MIKKLFIVVCICITAFSCKKAIEPLDFKSNPVDPASGVKLKMIEIDSVNYGQSFWNGPYRIVYFHVNFDQIPKQLGTPWKIDIYYDEIYQFNRQINLNNNSTYSFYFYGGTSDFKLGFIIVSFDVKRTDMIKPVMQ